MDRSQASTDPHRDAAKDRAAADGGRVRASARVRWAVAIVALLALIVIVPIAFKGWEWYRWTRTDAYQLERIKAQTPALLDELEEMDSVDRWIAVAALVDDPRQARIRALAIKEPYHRLRALGRLAAILARAGADDEAMDTRQELNKAARILEISASQIGDPGQKVEAMKAIALALCDAGIVEPSLAVARRAGEVARGTSGETPLWSAWSRLAVELAARGQSQPALELVSRIGDRRIRLQALTQIATELDRQGQADRAREVAILARDLAEKEPDATTRWQALGTVATSLAQFGMAEEARATAMRIEPKRARCDAFLAMVEACAKRGLPAGADEAAAGAREAAQEIHEPEPRWAVLVHLAKLLVVYQRMEEARETAILVQEASSDIPGEAARRLGTTTIVASILADAGPANQAVQAAHAAQEAARRVSGPAARSAALGAAARILAGAGHFGRARETAILARDTAMRIEDPRARDGALMKVCLTIARGRFGLELERDFSLQIEDPEMRYEALQAFLVTATDAKRSDEAGALATLARDAATRIGNPFTRSTDLLTVTRAQLRLDLPDEADRTARLISNPVSHSAASLALARSLARKHRFREAREAAEACDLPVDRLEAFTAVVIALTRARKPRMAAALDELEGPQGEPGPLIEPPSGPAR